METGNRLGSIDKVPRFPGENRAANPADAVFQSSSDLSGALHGFDMALGLFAFYHYGRRWWYYLARKRVIGDRGKVSEQDWLHQVDLYICQEFQFVGVWADYVLHLERAEFLPAQLPGRACGFDVPSIQPNLVSGIEPWGRAASLVISFRVPVLDCGHLGFG